MAHTVITVGREYGSGGRLIAQKAAEALGIPFFDRSIINMAAEETGLSADFIRRTEQQKTSSFLYNLYMSTQSLPVNDQVFIAQSEVIRRVAAEGPCIIVGRCADYVLRDNPNMVTVFITADLDDRISNVCKRRNCSAEEARKLIEDKESTRSSYYNYYSGKTWGASASYDLCVNASRLGAEGTKEFVADFIRRRMKR